MKSNVYFGTSMYGGYYIEWLNEDGSRGYKRFKRMDDLKAFAKEQGIDLYKSTWWEN